MYKNKAFISYRHTPRDIATAQLVQKKLEQYRIPREIASTKGIKRIGRIFLDQTDLGGKPDLTKELQKELDDSEYLIVICSLDTNGSRWVKEEIAYFLKHHPASGILPVISEGDPREVLSSVFEGIKGLPVEMKACDFSGKRRQVIKEEVPRLASALIGCGYDDLIRRDHRFRRKKVITFVSAVIFLALGIAAYHYFSSARIKKSHEEQLASEAQRLAGESESALEKREQFDAIRYALQAFPDGERGYAAGGVICTLQKAVGAYVTEGRKTYAQVNEFTVDGLIDDWDYTETASGNYLAVQYEEYGQYALAVWNIEEMQLVLDIKAGDFFLSEGTEDSDNMSTVRRDMGSASLLVSSGTIFWSYGDFIASIDPESGRTIWMEQTENACQQSILADSGNVIVSLVTSVSEGDGDYSETLQFRNSSDGSLLPQGVIGLSDGKDTGGGEGYAEYPKALFSEGGQSLILEEDIRFYEASDDDHCLLYRIDLSTFEKNLLVKEKEILDFYPQDNRSIVLAAVEDSMDSGDSTGNISLKSIDIQTGTEAWSGAGVGTTEDFTCIIPGREIILLTGGLAGIFSSESGEKTGYMEFPAPVVTAFNRTGMNGRQVLEVVSQDGDLFIWDYREGEIIYQDALFPETVSRAGKINDSILFFCADNSETVNQERIMMFRDGVWDRELLKVSLPDEEEVPIEYFFAVVPAEGMFVLVGENGKAYGIDAASGRVVWSAFVGEDIELEGISEHDGIMLFSVFSDSSETDKEPEGSWAVLDMMTGRVSRISGLAAGLAGDTGQIEYYGSTLAGCYLEFIVCVYNTPSETDNEKSIYICRYSLNNGNLDVVDISEYIYPENVEYWVKGNKSGRNTACICVDPATDNVQQLIKIDWSIKEAILQKGGGDFFIHSSIPVKWSTDGSELAVVDKEGKMHLFSSSSGESSLLPKTAEQENGVDNENPWGTDDGYGYIAGYDFYNGSLVTVEAQGNRIRFRDVKDDISITLPTTLDNASDFELIRGMEVWADVNVAETRDSKMFLKYGDEAFLINPVNQTVEMEVGGFLCFNPVSDTMLIKDQAGLYIARRYTVADLIRKGEEILYGGE